MTVSRRALRFSRRNLGIRNDAHTMDIVFKLAKKCKCLVVLEDADLLLATRS